MRCLPSLEGAKLSTTYETVSGDTFDIISRKLYGFESEGGRIASANPGLEEPIAPGTSIVIPDLPGALVDSPQQQPFTDPDETALTIDGTRFRFWTDIQIDLHTDQQSVVSFSAPFDPDVEAQRELFRPMSFKPMSVTIGGVPVFTGTLVIPLPNATPAATVVSVSGYSLAAVLDDCTLPFSAYPKEFFDSDLSQIAQGMLAPFGLEAVFEAPAGAVFETVRPRPGGKVLPFLTELANQRNLVIGDSPTGQLVFRQSVTPGSPVARLEQGQTSLISVDPDFKPQQYYSHVTGTQAPLAGIKGASFTVKNPRLLNVVRPFTYELPDTFEGDVEAAVRAKAGLMFADSVIYTVGVRTWRDDFEALWKPNTTVTLLASKAAVYTEYEFEVRRVQLTRAPDIKTATLELVIPGGFSGVLPEVLPWDS